jgi:hypothetical protein
MRDRYEYNRKHYLDNVERHRLVVKRHRAKKLGLPVPKLPAKEKPVYRGKCDICGIDVVRTKSDAKIDRCSKCNKKELRKKEYAKRNEERKARGRLVYTGKCARCGVEVIRFKADGITDRCDSCRSKDMYRAGAQRDPERGSRAYRKRREKNIEYAKKWAQENRARRRQHANNWHKRNRDKSSAAYYRYMAGKLQRIPAWADLDAIAMFYEIARRVTQCTGIRFEVDHIVPLRGRDVSGLHVPNNLRVIPKSMNSRKSNLYEGPDSWRHKALPTTDSTTLRRSRTSVEHSP